MHFACSLHPVILGLLPSLVTHMHICTGTHTHTHSSKHWYPLPASLVLGILLQSWCRQGLGPWLTRKTPSTMMHTSLKRQNIWIIHGSKHALAACHCHYMCVYKRARCLCVRICERTCLRYIGNYVYSHNRGVSEGNDVRAEYKVFLFWLCIIGTIHFNACAGDPETVCTRKTLINIKYSWLNNQQSRPHFEGKKIQKTSLGVIY